MRISDWSSDVCSSDLPILARLILALGPLDQQPLLFSWFLEPLVAVRGTHAHSRVTRCEPVDRAFPPRDRLPGGIGQAEGERLGLERPMLDGAPRPARRPAAPGPGCRRQRADTWRPNARVRLSSEEHTSEL